MYKLQMLTEVKHWQLKRDDQQDGQDWKHILLP